jgi:hypothetical protein
MFSTTLNYMALEIFQLMKGPVTSFIYFFWLIMREVDGSMLLVYNFMLFTKID